MTTDDTHTFEYMTVCRATDRHMCLDVGAFLPVFGTADNTLEIPVPAVVPVARIDLPEPMAPDDLVAWLTSDAARDALREHLDGETIQSVLEIALDDLR